VTKPLNVIILSPNLPIPPIKGGAIETLIFETALNYKDVVAHVISQTDEEIVLPSDSPHISFHCFKTAKVILIVQGLFNKLARKGIFNLFNLFFLSQIRCKIHLKPDIVHIHNNLFCTSSIKKMYPRAKIILHMHNDFLFEHKYLTRQYKEVIDATDKIITVSNYVKKRIYDYYPVSENKIIVIHNGVSTKEFHRIDQNNPSLKEWKIKLSIGPNEKVVLYVGRVCEEKGVEYLIQAFKRLVETKNGLKLVIVGSSWFSGSGDSPYIRRIQELSKAISNKVIFTGFVPHNELISLYNIAYFCVVPSVFQDPFPLVPIESMSSGCPVVASAVGGIPEIVEDNKTGILVEPNNAADLYQKMRYLLDNENIRDTLVNNAFKYVRESYDWSVVAKRYEEVYIDMLKSKA